MARVKDITGGEGAYAALECVGGEESQKLIQVRGGTTSSRGGDRAWAGRD